MSYLCEYCEKESESAHTVTQFDNEGIEERLQLLCDNCYGEWLESIKG